MFLAGVESPCVIWRFKELLNWKSTAGVKVWKKEKMRKKCVCFCRCVLSAKIKYGKETKRAREGMTR